jgi:hypothetical protein
MAPSAAAAAPPVAANAISADFTSARTQAKADATSHLAAFTSKKYLESVNLNNSHIYFVNIFYFHLFCLVFIVAFGKTHRTLTLHENVIDPILVAIMHGLHVLFQKH